MPSPPAFSSLDVEDAVRARYGSAARTREEALCCPVEYDPRHLDVIPREVLERDYGCGDPSRYLAEGDVVLDLGSGGGKICFIASQVVGPKGHVIGIDMNEAMLTLARKSAPEVGERIGYANVVFHRARIQDLGVDLDRLDARLKEKPVSSARELADFEHYAEQLRTSAPLIPDSSVDVVVSNCVLNLVRDADKTKLLREIFRVLKPGGRIALSDIVSDEVVPDRMKADPELWSGCISGAFQESELLRGLEDAGFYGVALDNWSDAPFRVVDGIEFRAVTVTGRKGKEGPCFEGNHAMIYRGPWRKVEDDDGHVLRRGERTAVCVKTFRIYSQPPYAGDFVAVPPRVEIPEDAQKPFDCNRRAPRHPRETKGEGYDETTEAAGACCPSEAD
ncbi:MAG: methyltransferase domain-containing protein [Myxococcota bacterium]